MLTAVSVMLAQAGPVSSVYVDFMPEGSDACAGLFLWDQTHPEIDDGTSTRFVQVRVRDPDYGQAMASCAAIVALLDSGDDEEPIADVEWPGPIIGRLRRGPLLYERKTDSVTVYAEVSLWGKK